MSDELKYVFKRLKAAFKRLEESVPVARSDLQRDGVVQRFEFTFELIWKTLKVALEEKGVIVRTPKDALSAAFKLGWIRHDLVFIEMLEARNQMSHEYNEAEARKVFNRIKSRFIKPVRQLIAQLETRR